MICAWMVTSRAATHSSAMIKFRVDGERASYAGPLALAAAHRARLAVEERAPQADQVEQFAAACRNLRGLDLALYPQDLRQHLANGKTRIEGVVGVLEHHGGLTSQHAEDCATRCDVRTIEPYRA